MQSKLLRMGTALLLCAGAVAACGDDDDGEAAGDTTTTAAPADDAPTTTGDAPADDDAGSGEPGAFAAEHYTTDLSDACPNPLRIQLSWLAEPEYAVAYQLIGGGGEMSQNKYSGPLGSTGIDLEIIDGGPGIDFAPVPSALYAGNLVAGVTPDLGLYGDGDAITTSGEFPTISVLQSFDRDPQNLVFDPEHYDITDIDSLVAATTEEDAQLYVLGKFSGYVQYLLGQGVPDGAFIEGFGGDYDRFIAAGGTLINQGFSTDTNFRLEEELPEWGKPVDGVYLDELGYSSYPINVYVASNRLDELSDCLTGLVPLMQQAVVDYMADPAEVNEAIAEYNDGGFGAPFWTTSVEHNEAAHAVMEADELVSNGEDDTLGNAEGTRLQDLIDILVPILDTQGNDSHDPEVTPDDLFTDQFLDPSIGLP